MDKSHDFRFNNNDVLIIKKDGTTLTKEMIDEDQPWLLNKWNHKEQKYEPDETLEIGWYEDGLFYDGKEFQVISEFSDKIKYAYACMHDDTLCSSIIKEHFPHIKKIEMPSKRYTTKYYLQYWMEKYGFTLEDFLFNTKYVVLSCSRYEEFYRLLDLNLLNLEEIEDCSEPIYDEEEEEEKEQVF